MRHLRMVSRAPEQAQSVSPEVKLTFIRDFIEIVIPLVTNKDPQNPSST